MQKQDIKLRRLLQRGFTPRVWHSKFIGRVVISYGERYDGFTLEPVMQPTPDYFNAPALPTVRKGPRLASYPMGSSGTGAPLQSYGLTPSADYMTSLGSMANFKNVDFDKMSSKSRTALAGVLGVTLIATTLWTFAIGPWAVKQFQPDWSYGKRLVTSMIAAAILRIGRGLVASKEA